MNLEMFLLLLVVVSAFTGLFTEAVKKVLDDCKVRYASNFLAGIVAAVLAVGVSAGYVIMTESHINAQLIVYLIALLLLSWLAAMVGYDKVIQAISQLRGHSTTN